VLQGAPAADNVARQNSPGIVVNAPSTRVVILRNLVSRNWTEGIRVSSDSRVIIDNCRIENNRDFGIRASGSARLTIMNSLASSLPLKPGGPLPARRTWTVK
jgi:parallel beta-helix repeat protein